METQMKHAENLAKQIKNLDRNAVPSGILSLPVFNPIETTEDEDTYSYHDLAACISSLQFGTTGESVILPEYSKLREQAKVLSQEGDVPMTLLHYHYQQLHETDKQELIALFDTDETPNIAEKIGKSALKEDTVFIGMPMVANIVDGTKATFYFPEAFAFDNSDTMPTKIELDPGDGNGYREVTLGEKIEVKYTEKGTKNLVVKAKYGTSFYETRSTINVIALNLPAPNREFKLVAREAYRGTPAGGKVRIYYSGNNEGVKKPLFFWGGFDTGIKSNTLFPSPFDTIECSGLESFASQYDRFLRIALDNGYDIITLGWNNSRDYIQNNGYLVAALIMEIRTSYPASKDGVIVTGSMGGLIARWATMLMEQPEGIKYGEHNLNKIITLDTPHEGATIPIAFQYAIDYVASTIITSHGDAAREGRKVIESPAASQMLLQQFRPYWRSQEEPKPNGEREVLLADFNRWGNFPKKLESYAVSSGSARGKGQTNNNGQLMEPGSLLLKGSFNIGNIELLKVTKLHAVPNFPERNNNGLHALQISILGNFKQWDATIKKTLPYDSCPGGHWQFIPSLGNQLNTNRQMPFKRTSFIPMVSSLGIATNNLYMKVDNNTQTPFKSFYIPEDNEQHADLTPGNTRWIFNVLDIP